MSKEPINEINEKVGNFVLLNIARIVVGFPLTVFVSILFYLLLALRAWTATVLWSWFIVPLLEIRQLSFPQMFAVLFFWGFIKNTPSDNKDENKTVFEKYKSLCFDCFRDVAFALMFGYLFKIYLGI